MRSHLFHRHRLAVPVGMLSLALLAGCSGSGPGEEADSGEVTLSYAFFAPEQSFPGVQMVEWAERIQEETETDVNVELHFDGELAPSGEIYDAVREGVVDIGLDAPAYDIGRFPVSSAINLPLGFENSQEASATLLDLLEEYQPAEFAGYEVVTAFTTEPAYLQTQEPVTSREDLEGMELRSTGAQVPALRQLGVSAIGTPMPQVPEALAGDVIDGYTTSRETLRDFDLAGGGEDKVAYVTDYNFGISSTFVAVMDSQRFAGLPQDVQEAITALRPEMSQFTAQYHDEENVQGALEWAQEEQGLEIVELDEFEEAAWDEAVAGVIDDWLQEAGATNEAQQILQRTQELRDENAQ